MNRSRLSVVLPLLALLAAGCGRAERHDVARWMARCGATLEGEKVVARHLSDHFTDQADAGAYIVDQWGPHILEGAIFPGKYNTLYAIFPEPGAKGGPAQYIRLHYHYAAPSG